MSNEEHIKNLIAKNGIEISTTEAIIFESRIAAIKTRMINLQRDIRRTILREFSDEEILNNEWLKAVMRW